MDLKKILWAYDGSEESEHALEYAVFFAKNFNSEILGLNVNTITDFKYGHYPHYSYFIEKAAKVHDRDFKQKLKKINDNLEKEKIEFRTEIVKGSADDEICKSIEKNDIDLAVLGITGRGILGKILLGSTTSKVLAKTETPVLAVRKLDTPEEIKIEKILVPVDISEEFDSALITAYELAYKLKCNITVLHVINVGINLYEFSNDLIEKIVTGTRNELKRIIDNVKDEFRQFNNNKPVLRPKIVFGMNPGLKITDYSKRNSFDLIVMNTQRKKSFKKLILGSVTNQVITSSKCAVLAIKP